MTTFNKLKANYIIDRCREETKKKEIREVC